MADLPEMSHEELLSVRLWAEPLVEIEEGQKAVCSVILNRVKKHMAPSIRDDLHK